MSFLYENGMNNSFSVLLFFQNFKFNDFQTKKTQTFKKKYKLSIQTFLIIYTYIKSFERKSKKNTTKEQKHSHNTLVEKIHTQITCKIGQNTE